MLIATKCGGSMYRTQCSTVHITSSTRLSLSFGNWGASAGDSKIYSLISYYDSIEVWDECWGRHDYG